MKLLTANTFTMLLFVGITSTFFVGCHKKTRSQFVLNKYEYTAGEMLDITNVKPKKKQVWSITNSDSNVLDTIFDRQPQFVLSLLMADGVYNLNLYDNEKEFKSDVKTSKSFVVKTIRNLLKISANSSSNKNYEVFVDGEKLGKTTNGKFNVELPLGMRHVKIVLPTSIYTETILIKEGNSQSIYF